MGLATMQCADKLRVANMFVFAANVSGQGTALRMPCPHLGGEEQGGLAANKSS